MDSVKQLTESEPAIILFAHGSAVEEANEGVRELARRIQGHGAYVYVRASFLGPGQPELGPAIAQAIAEGFNRIVVIPYFLTLGTHLRRDLPRLVAAEKQKHPGIDIRVGRSLEDHPEMISLVLSRIREITEGTRVSP
ncbi:MAG TPA: CbiX/SirB N-terminal domain-containing protein [Terriglobia bacterium]|nr:CbiX/SirB N-terminal domain-containing protein [Terriglobia bacterium]